MASIVELRESIDAHIRALEHEIPVLRDMEIANKNWLADIVAVREFAAGLLCLFEDEVDAARHDWAKYLNCTKESESRKSYLNCTKENESREPQAESDGHDLP